MKRETKSKPVMVRMTPSEKKSAEEKARAKGLTLSAWLRMLAVTAPLLLLASPTRALDRWTWQDTAWEGAFVATLAADWGQTRDLAWQNGHRLRGDRMYPVHNEGNPLLGARPGRERIDLYFASAALTHAGVAVLLPGRWRRAWQAAGVGLEVIVVQHNAQMSLRVRF